MKKDKAINSRKIVALFAAALLFLRLSYAGEISKSSAEKNVVVQQPTNPSCFLDGKLYNGYDANLVSSTGAKKNGIEKMARHIVTRGALLDIPRVKGVEWLEPGYGITAQDLDAALLMLDHSAESWESADLVGRGLLAAKAKYLATETALEVTSKVIQVVGGRGAYRDFPAERALRDVRTSTLMPPIPDRMLEAIGKSALGLDTPMFTAKT